MAAELAMWGTLLLRSAARRAPAPLIGGLDSARCLSTSAGMLWSATPCQMENQHQLPHPWLPDPGCHHSSHTPGPSVRPSAASASSDSPISAHTTTPVLQWRQQPRQPLQQQPLQYQQHGAQLSQQRSSSTSTFRKTVKHGKPAPKPKARPVREKALNFKRNAQIRDPEVRVVLPEGGSQLMPAAEALALAQSRGLDLVEVSRSPEGPVAKLVDYSRFLFEAKQAAQDADKKAREKAKLQEPKEMHFTARIADHDLEVKMKRVAEFLAGGYRVSLVVKHGRGEAEAADEAAEYLATRLHTEYGSEALPKQVGTRSVTVTVKPGKAAKSTGATES